MLDSLRAKQVADQLRATAAGLEEGETRTALEASIAELDASIVADQQAQMDFLQLQRTGNYGAIFDAVRQARIDMQGFATPEALAQLDAWEAEVPDFLPIEEPLAEGSNG